MGGGAIEQQEHDEAALSAALEMHDCLKASYEAAAACRISPWDDNLPLEGFYESLKLRAAGPSGAVTLSTLYRDYRRDLGERCQNMVELTLAAEVASFDELIGPYRRYVIRNLSRHYVPGSARRELTLRTDVDEILGRSAPFLALDPSADSITFGNALTVALTAVHELRDYVDAVRQTLHSTRTAMDHAAASRNASRAVVLAVVSTLVAVLAAFGSIFAPELRCALLTGRPLFPLLREVAQSAKDGIPGNTPLCVISTDAID